MGSQQALKRLVIAAHHVWRRSEAAATEPLQSHRAGCHDPALPGRKNTIDTRDVQLPVCEVPGRWRTLARLETSPNLHWEAVIAGQGHIGVHEVQGAGVGVDLVAEKTGAPKFDRTKASSCPIASTDQALSAIPGRFL